MGPTPTRTPTPTLGMRLSCNFVNVYTIAYRVQYTKSTGKSRRVSDKSARILVHVRLVDDPRAEVCEDVCVSVGVRVGVVECQLKLTTTWTQCNGAMRAL